MGFPLFQETQGLLNSFSLLNTTLGLGRTFFRRNFLGGTYKGIFSPRMLLIGLRILYGSSSSGGF